MIQSFDAVFENGVLRPLEPLRLPEHSTVRLQLSPTGAGAESAQSLSAEDFERELLALTSDGPTLPPDFSRDDIYSDHD